MTALNGIGVGCEALAVFLLVMGCYNLFRTIVMEFRGSLGPGEGTTFARIASITLGAGTAFAVSGALLLR